jgi:hypothetical protein
MKRAKSKKDTADIVASVCSYLMVYIGLHLVVAFGVWNFWNFFATNINRPTAQINYAAAWAITHLVSMVLNNATAMPTTSEDEEDEEQPKA